TLEKVNKVNKLMSGEDIIKFQNLVRRVPVSDNVLNYAVNLVRVTRPDNSKDEFVKKYIEYGAGPRASQYLILGAKSRAALHGRFTPDIGDVKEVAVSVLRHRIVSNFSAEAEGISTKDII